MNDNIKAGADIHAGDGGYSEGTKEAYEAFVKEREQSMVSPLIRELWDQASKTVPDNSWSGMNRFMTVYTNLVVQECARIAEIKEQGYKDFDADTSVGWYIRKKFGVE